MEHNWRQGERRAGVAARGDGRVDAFLEGGVRQRRKVQEEDALVEEEEVGKGENIGGGAAR